MNIHIILNDIKLSLFLNMVMPYLDDYMLNL